MDTAPETSDNLSDSLKDIQPFWQRWRAAPTILAIQNLGGHHNKNFLLDTESAKFVLRINGDPGPGVNRYRELKLSMQAARLGLSPQVCFADADCQIREYLPADSAYTPGGLGQMLDQIHMLAVPDWPPLDLHEEILSYLKLLNIPTDCAAAKFAQQISFAESPITLCHNDLNPGNLIPTAKGLRLIDWEYAHPGPAWFDLAVALESHHYEEDDCQALLDHYHGRLPDPDQLRRYRLFYQLLEKLWMTRLNPDKNLNLWLEQWHEKSSKNTSFAT